MREVIVGPGADVPTLDMITVIRPCSTSKSESNHRTMSSPTKGSALLASSAFGAAPAIGTPSTELCADIVERRVGRRREVIRQKRPYICCNTSLEEITSCGPFESGTFRRVISGATLTCGHTLLAGNGRREKSRHLAAFEAPKWSRGQALVSVE